MTTIVTIDMGGTGATHAAGAREALSVPSMTDMGNAYAQANAAYAQANSAFNGANNARVTVFANNGSANVTTQNINFLNTSTILVTVANTSGNGDVTFSLNGTPYDQANTARNTANDAYSQANAAYDQANGAYGQANTARSDANTTFGTINSTFGTINTNYQAAYAQANVARTTANDAYATANTKLGTSGGSISGDLTISGNLTVQGNATTINVSNLSVNDSIILLSANSSGDAEDIGFIGHITRDSTNTHVGLIRKATENRFYLFDNYEVEPTNNTIDITGNNFRVGNIRLGTINANSFVTAAGLDVTGQANAAYGQANTARSDANTTFATINTTFGTINTSFGTINTSYQAAYAQANTARTTANDAYGQANAAYGQANAAYGAANNRVLKAGDTMTGALNIQADAGNEQLVIKRSSNANQQLIFGFHSNNYASIQSIEQNVAYRTLVLNRDGGNVAIGTTSAGQKLTVNGGIESLVDSGGGVDEGGQLILRAPSGGNTRWCIDNFQNKFRIFREDDSTLANGAAYFHIINGGNIGIGTTDPVAGLHINTSTRSLSLASPASGGGGGSYIIMGNNDSGGTSGPNLIVAANRSLTFGVGDSFSSASGGTMTEYMRIASGGNVGIGTNNPAVKLHVYNGAPSGAGSVPTGTNILIDNNANNFITFRHSADSALYSGIVFEDNNIGGYVIHGDGSSGDKLYIAGYGGVEIQQGAASSVTPGARTTIGNFTSTGLAVTGTISESSSITIKENIIPISDALKIVLQLSGVTYDRKDGSAKKRAGLIAEQVNEILPNVVQKDNDGNPSGIQYTNLIAYLVESIKELKAEIDTLKGK